MTTLPIFRQLIADDAAAFRALRLAGLQEAPTAFGSSYAKERDSTVEDFAGTIARNHMVGALIGDRLVGVAGFYRSAGEKVEHRGNIWGVYVEPEARGQGIARGLIERLLEHAKTVVEQVHLCVVTDNVAAVRLYEGLGFVSYGTEPRALKVDGTFYDELMMVWRAD